MTWFGSFFLLHYILTNCKAEVQKKTWIDSADSCILANFEEVNKMKRQYTDSWIGGYYETTPWMEYLGCFYTIGSNSNNGVKHQLSYNNPSICYQKCVGSSHFALKNNTCICKDSLQQLTDAESGNCNLRCSNDVNVEDPVTCGGIQPSSEYLDVYKLSNVSVDSEYDNQNHLCSVQTKTAKKGIAKQTASCRDSHHALCFAASTRLYSDDSFEKTYANATQTCRIVTVNSDVDEMAENVKYWANIRRFNIQSFVTNATDVDTLRDKMSTNANSRCLAAKQTKGHLPTIYHLPCNNILPFICSALDPQNDTMYSVNLTDLPEINFTSTEPGTSENTSYSSGKMGRDIDVVSDVFIIELCFIITFTIVVLFLAVFWFYVRCQSKEYTLVSAKELLEMKKLDDIYFPQESTSNNRENDINIEVDNEIADFIKEPKHESLGLVYEDIENSINPERSTNIYAKPTKIAVETKSEYNVFGKSAINEYDHMDHENIAQTRKNAFSGNEYGVPQKKGCIERVQDENNEEFYLQPWDNKESKLNRMFSNVKKSVLKRGQQIRKSVSIFQTKEDTKETENTLQRHSSQEEKMNGSIQTVPIVKNVNTISDGIDRLRRTSAKDRFQRMFSFKTFRAPNT